MRRLLMFLAVVCTLLIATPSVHASTAWSEGWENGFGSWETWGEPEVDCNQGYVAGCALAIKAAYYESIGLSRAIDYAQIGPQARVSFLYKTNTFDAPGWGAIFSLWLEVVTKDGMGHSLRFGVSPTNNRATFSENGYSSWGSLAIPQPNAYYAVVLDLGADGRVTGRIMNAAMSQTLSQTAAWDLGSPMDTLEFVDLVGTLAVFHPREVYIDNVAVTGDIAAMTPPGAPLNLQARIVPTPGELLSGGAPGPGEAAVSWDPPASDGNRPIQYYMVTRAGPDGTHPVYSGLERHFIDTGLQTGTYTYTATATNVRGTGPESAPAVLTAITGPPPVDGATIEGPDGVVAGVEDCRQRILIIAPAVPDCFLSIGPGQASLHTGGLGTASASGLGADSDGNFRLPILSYQSSPNDRCVGYDGTSVQTNWGRALVCLS